MPTPNRGFVTTAANSPDYNVTSAQVLEDANWTVLDTINGGLAYSASGAITQKEGVVALTGAAALAMTLAAPTAGLPSAGGDDFKYLTIFSTHAVANTVTTPANAINGSKHIATFAGSIVGEMINLIAYQGVWYEAPSTGITLS